MRKSALAAIALLLALRGVALHAQGHSRSSDAEQLRQIETGWTTALVRRDAAYFQRTLHPDYVYSDERGVFGKAQVIDEQLGTDTVTFATNESMQTHVHGSAGAVTGILIVRGHGKSGPFEHRYRYTDSFVRENGRWLMFASQDYEIPRK